MSFKVIQFLIFIIVSALISSCGKKVEEEVHDAVLSANILLSTSQCQQAIDLLEAIGNQPRDSAYLKTYATAYACRAGYSTTVFFGSDIAKTAAPSPIGGVTTYSTSLKSVTNPLINDTNFKDLQKAIDILLYAGGISTTTEPNSIERAKYFNVTESGEINTQLAFMMLVQLGKMMKVYANASLAGVKGAGGAGNNCFTDYSTTPALVQTYITSAGATGVCNTVSSSHTQLATAASNRKAKLCQGVVLMNGVLDLLPSILTSAAGGSLSDISTVTSVINTQKNELVTRFPIIGTTLTVLSQANCESDTSVTVDTLAAYYAVIFEGLIQ